MLYCFVLFCIVLCCFVLLCIVLYCTISCYIALFHIMSYDVMYYDILILWYYDFMIIWYFDIIIYIYIHAIVITVWEVFFLYTSLALVNCTPTYPGPAVAPRRPWYITRSTMGWAAMRLGIGRRLVSCMLDMLDMLPYCWSLNCHMLKFTFARFCLETGDWFAA